MIVPIFDSISDERVPNLSLTEIITTPGRKRVEDSLRGPLS